MATAPNYNESTVAGTKWTRACRVVVENPLNAAPSILIVEEDAINLDERVICNLSGNLSTTFDVENPLHLTIYEKLNELYMLLREARDTAIAA